MANHKSGAERYNDRMSKIFETAKQLESARLERGEMPNPGLTDPQTALRYGWIIEGREVRPVADLLVIPNIARHSLDAYNRFHTGFPCWDKDNTDKYKTASTFTGNPGESRDGLWHFSTRPY